MTPDTPCRRARSGIHAALVAVLAFGLGQAALADSLGPGTCAIRSDAPAAIALRLDALIEGVMAGLDPAVDPGAVLSVSGQGWRYVRALGMADPDSGLAVDCAMPFQIGSNTKMMTATIILQLHEEGRLSVDDPLSLHLPDIAARLPHGDAITIRQLLQHTSGVFSYTDPAPDGTSGIAMASATDPAAMRRGVTPQEMVDIAIDHGRPTFAPGAPGQWHYSNTGYVLLGMVIEQIEGLALDKSIENRIFQPLGMTRSYLWDGIPRAAFGLPRSWLKPPFDYETTEWNVSQSWAAGGVISTADDMHRFIDALARGELFADPATLALMQQTVPSPIPGTSDYGLGLIRIDGDVWGHGGATLAFISAIGASAGQDVSFVVWANAAASPVGMIAPAIITALHETGVTEP
jgi:D-alanyl-D-alanine carboxypeptidase